jgi:hypothetical protein
VKSKRAKTAGAVRACRRKAKMTPEGYKEYRRQERLRAKERSYKKPEYAEATRVAAQKLCRKLAEKENREFDRAVARQKPWNAPGLSRAGRWKIRYHNDPAYNARQKMKTSLYAIEKQAGIAGSLRRCVTSGSYSPGTAARLGYTVAEFMANFEKQFTTGMSWKSFVDAKLVIDHIRPLADFPKPIDVKEAWGLANLQPLFAHVNRAKSARLDYPANVFFWYSERVVDGEVDR